MKIAHFLAAISLFGSFVFSAFAEAPDGLETNDVTWDSLGKDYRDSMPVGNGDIALNAWTEQNGDLVFLIGKTDAWTENGMLVKLGRVRVSLSPNPFAKAGKFQQTLRLREGEMVISTGSPGETLRVWVDANQPVAHVEFAGATAVELKASVELWRTKRREVRQGGRELDGQGSLRELNNIPGGKLFLEPDTVLPARGERLVWLHRNERSVYPEVMKNQHLESLLVKYPDPLLHRTFGVSMGGAGLVPTSDTTLKSTRAATTQRLDLVALTRATDTLPVWQKALEQTVAATSKIDLEAARKAHLAWWSAFWERSWINVSGTPEATAVTQSYVMQRYMNACGGRGAQPIKYNGSILTVGQEPPPGTPYDPAKGYEGPDFRAWGGNLWFQNTRLIYWPMIASGDHDLLYPFLKMYADALPLAKDRNRLYFKHAGATFPETIYFWGTPNNNDFGWENKDVIMVNPWVRYYVSGTLELTMMLLDSYEHTLSANLAQNALLPIADGVTTYYDEHWKRDAAGKIHMDPAQALETQQQAVNPTPDLAGLRAILPRLLALPGSLTTPAQRSRWTKMLADLPPVPVGHAAADGKVPLFGKDDPSGKPVILPAGGEYSKPNNVENTELYPVFPYRLYGVGKPELEMARNTYASKTFQSSTCWGQDGIQAALLGLTDTAKAEAIANATAYGGERFKWFWKRGHDWEPDMDNGGAGQLILQTMLMQCEGRQIRLLPAWPQDWSVNFKLHAPFKTIVEGRVQNGKIEVLKVTPAERRKDVVIGAQ